MRAYVCAKMTYGSEHYIFYFSYILQFIADPSMMKSFPKGDARGRDNDIENLIEIYFRNKRTRVNEL